jgi:hypothetical protein
VVPRAFRPFQDEGSFCIPKQIGKNTAKLTLCTFVLQKQKLPEQKHKLSFAEKER